MARMLIGTVPIVGHINPFLPLVRSLVARGHEVRWYTGAKYRARVEAAGAMYLPMVEARDYDDADINGAFPGRELRKQVGLDNGGWLLDGAATSSLYLNPSVPGFEYPRSDLPGHVHHIGLLPVEAPPAWQPPAWWGELDGGRPVVHVSQGTIANVAPTLIKPALEGLAEEDVLVVVATGGRSPEQLGLGALPANARVGAFLSYPELLPRTAAMVTNGGYGGTQLALAAGVPLAVGGATEDKPEVAARVAWCGAGLNLKTAAPSPARVREAVRALLTDGRYRARAQELRDEYRRYDAVARATSLIEQLASTGRPVLQSGAEMSLVPVAAPAQGD